jgi:adenylate kinase
MVPGSNPGGRTKELKKLKTMNFDTIFIAGPQGSGKGTQGKMLAEKLGFSFWEMGAMAREVSHEDSPLGKRVAGIIDGGGLLPDETIIEISREKLAAISPTQGIIFDGIPRRIGQAEFLVNFLKSHNRKKPLTIFLDLPREHSIKRLLLRAEKEGRKDDTPKGIEKRFQHYDEDTKPMLNYLKKETRFMEVDGSPPVSEVTQEINRALGLGL